MSWHWLVYLINPFTFIVKKTARFLNLSGKSYVIAGHSIIFFSIIVISIIADEYEGIINDLSIIPLIITASSLFLAAGGLIFLIWIMIFSGPGMAIRRVLYKRFLGTIFLKLPGLFLFGLAVRFFTAAAEPEPIFKEMSFIEIVFKLALPFSNIFTTQPPNAIFVIFACYGYMVFLAISIQVWLYNYHSRITEIKSSQETYLECKAAITDRESRTVGSGKNRHTTYTIKYGFMANDNKTYTAKCSTSDKGDTRYILDLYGYNSQDTIDVKYKNRNPSDHYILANRIYGKGEEYDPVYYEFKAGNIDKTGSYAVWGLWLMMAGITLLFSTLTWQIIRGIRDLFIISSVSALFFSIISFIVFLVSKGKGR
ncbi:MAG: hypothetical protein JW969_10465 [Spirochaetales bacterium]|nr:hypothetical protein [Spirochaetales bacterium]